MAIHQSPSIYWGFRDIRIFCLIVFYTCDGLAFCLPLRYFISDWRISFFLFAFDKSSLANDRSLRAFLRSSFASASSCPILVLESSKAVMPCTNSEISLFKSSADISVLTALHNRFFRGLEQSALAAPIALREL